MLRTEERIRVVLGGRRDLFREGVAKILDGTPDMHVIGQGATGSALVAAARGQSPDVVLVDADVPGLPLMTLLRQLLAIGPSLSIAVLHADDDVRTVSKAMGLGVHAFISKESTGEDLAATIRSAARSQDRVLLSVPRRMMERLSDPDGGILTEREIEVVELVAQGLRNSEIARSLFISEGTVKRHLTNIYVKLGVDTRISAVNKAEAMRLLTPRRQPSAS
ncbi:response regulator transcription factor [Streptomyces sp. NPDC046727]|uniref:response regulator transcription factor n=1 Tax=Streptomyces sp. NPDC046727 TaxID=3155373 RepID=UPI0033DB5ED4